MLKEAWAIGGIITGILVVDTEIWQYFVSSMNRNAITSENGYIGPKDLLRSSKRNFYLIFKKRYSGGCNKNPPE